MTQLNASRRKFLQTASQLSVAGAAAPFALNMAGIGAAAAQTATDYKALVCVFLNGANDHNNTIIPFDTANYDAYRNARPTIARALADMVGPSGESLELVPSIALTGANAGRKFALPKELAPLKSIWDANQLAVLANVGPLVVPTSPTQYKNGAVPLPPKLFSHNDQVSVWQASQPEGASYGWGGRLGDLFASRNTNGIFTANSISGSAVWLAGQTVAAYQLSSAGSVRISSISGNLFGSSTASAAMKSLITSSGAHLFAQDLADVTTRSINADADLAAALANVPDLPVPDAENSLAAQLRVVARMIAARDTLGAKRQVFFVQLGGFDTHDNQLQQQPLLHASVAGALKYFYEAMNTLKVASQVTTFTASDFGRTLTSNGDGSDHGWGGHHFIMGGAVQGKRFYGSFPQMGLGNADDIGSGRTVPTTSVDQYAATLARWFGVTSDSDLKLVLPNIGEFGSSNLGFMG
ncbi:MAG: DUF1501 domain-containing protein [Burkholderiaceae bacterium]